MIPIGMLSQEKQTMFLFLLLLVVFGEVILLVYKSSHLLPLIKLIPDGTLAFALLVLLFFLDQDREQPEWMLPVPTGILAALLILLSFYITSGFLRERKLSLIHI